MIVIRRYSIVVLLLLLLWSCGFGYGEYELRLPRELEAARTKWLEPHEEAVLLDKRPGLASKGALFHVHGVNGIHQMQMIADVTNAANILKYEIQRAERTNNTHDTSQEPPLAFALVLDFKMDKDALPEETQVVFDKIYASPVGHDAARSLGHRLPFETQRIKRMVALMSTPFEKTLFVASSVKFCSAPREILATLARSDVAAALDGRLWGIEGISDLGLHIHTGLFGYARNDRVRAVFVDVLRELEQRAASKHGEFCYEDPYAGEDYPMSIAFDSVLRRYNDHPDVRVQVLPRRFHLHTRFAYVTGEVVALSGNSFRYMNPHSAREFINKVPRTRLIQPARLCRPGIPNQRLQPARVWHIQISRDGSPPKLQEQPDEPLNESSQSVNDHNGIETDLSASRFSERVEFC
eukprot:CAMPEP_0185854876 /NCGR_PEP_ID=MMETSP1354-20130828/23760_1 /TAXON_ID=708628 /ORGANISM="Erythrolobus madagascarensis, Strain CCMP3276" /LENGTH=408 /DNA_ID=CAMNT_0028556739 /DNA_START=379 /DNA_END=1605 /DNA_ORIENTATION=+